jgi:hypothetical protein
MKEQIKKLISIASYGDYYSVCNYNIEDAKLESIMTQPNMDFLSSYLDSIIFSESRIIFDNNDNKLTRFLIDNYKNQLLETTNIFKKQVKGVMFSKNVESYGFDVDAVKSVEYTTNLNKYLIIKSEGL